VSEAIPPDAGMRRRILNLVQAYPGLHLREIARRIHTNPHLIEYHLAALERLDLVTTRQEGGYRRLFPVTGPRATLLQQEQRWLSLLRQPVPLAVALHLLERESAQHRDLAQVVHVTKATLTHHLKSMENVGIITREPPETGRVFRLIDAPRVLALLRAFQPTPDLLSAYSDMWTEIFGSVRDRLPDDGA